MTAAPSSSRPTARCRDRRRGQRAPAHRQGLWPGARAGGRRRRAAERFERVGYAVVQGRSDWVFGPDDRDIQDELLRRLGRLAARASAICRPTRSRTGCRGAALIGRRPLVDARRSRRCLRPADRHALSAEVAVEQHLVAEHVGAHRRAQRLVDPLDRRQDEARPARRRG